MRTRIAILLLSGGLTACAAVEAPQPVPPPPPARPAVTVPPPPPARPAPPARRLDPAQLRGLSAEQATALLGPPDDDEAQQLGRLWRWRKGGCTLTLALYPEVESSSLRVAASEFAGTSDPAACLAGLRRDGGGHGR